MSEPVGGEDDAAGTRRHSRGELTAEVRAAQQGDEQAFRVLYRTLTPELLRYAGVIVGQDAEDVVAEAWLQVARDVMRFDGDGPAFRRFALAVTRNRARDLVRRRRRRVPEVTVPWDELPESRDPLTGGVPDVAETAGARFSAQEVLELIGTLPEPQAEAVVLRVLLDLDTKGAAQVLGKRPGAVAMALSRGLKRLAHLVERPAETAAVRR
ncbi:RNA polymerase sigma factor [Streptomyces sp. JJ36]|uniref:RNA polymerase sigma factor n=1 Tax=Streptomyces sp. JJ36 TaxID=2736645 RepID=UPI001F1AF7B2|nr:RNA polymerase sigma factor [Streptomyces sp. JJ36]